MLKINDLGTERELDQEAMKELRGGQYTKGDGVTVGSNKRSWELSKNGHTTDSGINPFIESRGE